VGLRGIEKAEEKAVLILGRGEMLARK